MGSQGWRITGTRSQRLELDPQDWLESGEQVGINFDYTGPQMPGPGCALQNQIIRGNRTRQFARQKMRCAHVDLGVRFENPLVVKQ